LLHYSAPPVVGGVEIIVAAHARILREAGHDVAVVAGRGDAELVPEVDSLHAEVERLTRRLAGGDAAPREFEALQQRLTQRLRPLVAGCDAVIAHNVLTMPFNLPLAAALAALESPPVVAWTHDLAWINPRYTSYRRPGWPWSILHEAQPSVRYVTISRARRGEVASTLGLRSSDIRVVPNGVDPAALWRLAPATRELVRRAGLEAAHPLILMPIQINPHKRVELALEAAALLQSTHPELKLVVTGPVGSHYHDGMAYMARLRELRTRLGLEGTVVFLHEHAGPDGRHPVGDRTIADLYMLADLVVLSSASEGFGIPVLEAALSRVPLVCPDIGALREVMGASAGTFPANGGPEALVDAARRALRTGPAQRRRRVLRAFVWPVILGHIESVIADCRRRR
jgi:glycosyltransferase involved in cell wall biosynthesis